MREWAGGFLADLQHSAAILDEVNGDDRHSAALGKQIDKLHDPSLTPSGRMLAEMQNNKQSFFRLAMNLSQQHRDTLRSNADDVLDAETRQKFLVAGKESLRKQEEIEAADEISFDEFLRRWNEA